MDDRLGPDAKELGIEVPMYALGATVYVERGDEILLLKRAAGSALAGQWFLPGGGIERDELPEDGARRELLEEAGLEIEGELELIGAYPMHAYGLDMLNLSFRGRVPDDAEVIVSHEHDGAQWVKPTDMRLLLDDTFIAQLSAGDERIRTLLTNIAADLDRYLARISERPG